MTGPELQRVIRDALRVHTELGFDNQDHTTCAGCETYLASNRAPINEALDALTAHQACAVLAALGEAGEVEWGVAWKGAGPSGVLAFDSEEDAREAVELGGLLSRLTLPWTAVE